MESDDDEYSPKWLLIALGAVAAVVLVGVAAALAVPLQPPLGGGGGKAAAGSVSIPDGVGSNLKLNFNPATVTVIIGKNSTITWVNSDTVTHTVTAVDNSFNSGDVKAGASWTYTFSTPGTFAYYCIYHSSWMKGTVVVSSA
jgi:plastocyanin